MKEEKAKLASISVSDSKLFWLTLRRLMSSCPINNNIQPVVFYEYFSNLFVQDLSVEEEFSFSEELHNLLSCADIIPDKESEVCWDI